MTRPNLRPFKPIICGTLTVLFMFMTQVIRAAEPDMRSMQFSTHNGLSDNTVREIYQDSRGYIWFATFNGLSRYDGYNVIKYTPSQGVQMMQDAQIRKLMEDGNHRLWIIANNDQIGCLDLEADRFVEIMPEGDPHELYRYAKELADGSVWLWGENGARRITCAGGKTLSQKIDAESCGLASDKVLRIESDHRGNTLISTSRGLCMWHDGMVTTIDSERQYQWFYATGSATLMVAGNGDIMRLDSDGNLCATGRIEGIHSRGDLPGAYAADGKWHLTSARGGVDVDLATFEVRPTPASLDLRSAKVIGDSNGDVWLHNETGYLYYRAAGATSLVALHLIPERVMKLIDMERYSVARDKQGRAWITTAENGLFIFNPSTGEFRHITTAGNNYRILPSNILLTATADREGNIWVGSEHAGATMLKPDNDRVTQLAIPRAEGREMSVRMIKKLPNGSIALSARDGNLYKYSPDLSSCEVLPRGTLVYDMDFDSAGNQWEASRGEGLLKDGLHPERCPTTTSNSLFAVHCDKRGRIWAGTFGSGLDVMIPEPESGGYRKLNFLNENYAQRRIRAIFEDNGGMIWVATNAGAWRFDPERLLDGLDSGTHFSTENNTLRSNEIHCIEQDSHGRIWLGEAGNGISILDFSDEAGTPHVTHIDTESGMGHNNVQAFVREGDDYIWATTLYGASRISTQTLSVESFVFLSDPTANIHSANSAVRLDDGRLLLGTTKGAYTVDITEPATRGAVSPLCVTQLRINGETLNFSSFVSDPDMDGDYNIRLPHDRNNIDFDLSTFDFEWPKQTRFRYMLAPLDRQWSQASVDNRISLKNLQPGDYTLSVEASDALGQWTRRFECRIVIAKPWWASWWAKMLYLLLFITGAVLVMRVVQRINELHNKVKVEEQLTDYKLEFFTNISHEFRTPLTLIQVSLEKIHEKISALKADHPGFSLSGLGLPLATLDKNSRRMSRLIDELLTFRKVEKNKMVIFPEPTEVVAFLGEIWENFHDEALSKRLEFRFQKNCDNFMMNVDNGALDKIANNLLSNALKYTRESGSVLFSVTVDEELRTLRLQVIDNGVGIAPDKREQLFSRFMQSAMSRNSIGVGLHLTFGLVELHRGTITHSDNPGGGSIFTVELPTDLPAAENRPQDGIGRPSFDAVFKSDEERDADTQSAPAPDDPVRKKMLIIDDDADIRTFLANEFSRRFDIITASDGRSGLDAARGDDVNIIICDVMMPDMSGFEVTRLLKEDFATSHIPIIQLTALSNDDCQIEGISSGADAYLTKPFNLRYLKTRVAKLIEQRDNLFAKFSANPTLVRPQLPMGDRDRKFAEKLAEIAERELDNSEFSVDDFASEMAMGRTIFFRKVKGVTGYAPKEYLRVMRMKKAAEMLLSTDLTITEISFRVGISDPAYFNKCFKSQFGKAPSVYQKENTMPVPEA